jgi:MinD-like ATPase involved in chromosome partitioning or flagellar assembly
LSQRVFVVIGAKGGVGATTLAIKLVARFPTLGERVIVDGDLSGRRSLAVWYDLSDALDITREIGSVTSASATAGMTVLEIARTYEDGLIQTTASVARSIAGLSDRALVVVDAPQPFAATIRPFVARATKFIVVTEPTPLGVGGARSLLAAMDRFGIPASRIALVLSNIVGRDVIPRADVEAQLEFPVSAELPNERDRRFEALFEGFLTLLAAASLALPNPNESTEKPVFDRRAEPRDLQL